jgi:glycine/D-amino acid oxidase-like deaminating enzyme
LDFIATANKQLKNRLNLNLTYSSCDERIENFGLSGVAHLLVNQHEGALDTGKMMHQLIKLAQQADITILNGMEVSQFDDSGTGVEVQFKNGIDIKCKKLHFATNGFTASLLPDLDVRPARAQVLISSPIKNLKVNGTFHMNEGYYYFRNVGNRILFGGGRQLAIETETDTALKTTRIIQDKLDEILGSMILPNTEFTVEHRWAGIMGVGTQKKAIVKQVSENVSCAVRLGGMGVAIGTSIGKQSADLIG